jgi:hypothetical protein
VKFAENLTTPTLPASNNAPATKLNSQPVPQLAGPPATESVTVSGTRMREGFQKFLRGFVAPQERLAKLTRWERRICPLVMGQNSHFNSFIAQRITYVALAAGARVNTEPSCTPQYRGRLHHHPAGAD